MRVKELINKIIQTLSENKIDESSIEALLIVAHSLGVDKTTLFMNYDKELAEFEIQSIYELVKRRLNYEPIEYLIGKVNFMGLEFLINPPVFIPRPETEVLVETIVGLAECKEAPIIYDIGTGCGAIGISILKFLPHAFVYASDIIDLKFANQNAIKHRVQDRIGFIKGSLFEPFKPFKLGVDFIVSNPPYIPTSLISNLQPEIRLFESHSSIDGGEDGLFFIHKLLSEGGKYLNPEGTLLLEISPEQEDKVREYAVRYFKDVNFIKDFCNNTRALVTKYAKSFS